MVSKLDPNIGSNNIFSNIIYLFLFQKKKKFLEINKNKNIYFNIILCQA